MWRIQEFSGRASPLVLFQGDLIPPDDYKLLMIINIPREIKLMKKRKKIRSIYDYVNVSKMIFNA